MLNFEQSSAFARQLNGSQNTKRSRWLRSSLKELDERRKAMLNLIESDADSFAQRAEMYYKKRPELVNLVDEFDKAYRHLAERYDQLLGEINENIPETLQAQYELTCDAPQMSALGNSPRRRDQEGFEKLLKKFETGQSIELSRSEDLEVLNGSDSLIKENGHSQEHPLPSSDPEIDNLGVPDTSGTLTKENDHSQENMLLSWDYNELQEMGCNLEENKELAQYYHSTREEDQVLQIKVKESNNLQELLCHLDKENKKLAQQYHFTEKEKESLKISVKELEQQVSILQEEKIKLGDKQLAASEESTVSEKKVKELEDELLRLQEENATLVEKTLQTSVHLKAVEDEVCALHEEKVVLKGETIEDKNEINRLQRKIELLEVEKANLTAVSLDRADQVCISENNVRQLQKENQKLEAEFSAAVDHGKVVMAALKFLKGEVSSFVQKNKKLRGELVNKTADETSKLKEISTLQEENKNLTSKLQDFRVTEEQRVNDLNSKIKDLHGQLTFLGEENKKQKLVLLDRAEEKREAIRQLCFSIDLLKEKNQRLEEALCSARMRLSGFRNSSSSYHLPNLKKIFLEAC